MACSIRNIPCLTHLSFLLPRASKLLKPEVVHLDEMKHYCTTSFVIRMNIHVWDGGKGQLVKKADNKRPSCIPCPSLTNSSFTFHQNAFLSRKYINSKRWDCVLVQLPTTLVKKQTISWVCVSFLWNKDEQSRGVGISQKKTCFSMWTATRVSQCECSVLKCAYVSRPIKMRRFHGRITLLKCT